VQILWLNLVTDSPPALALGFDSAEKDAMTNPPRDTKKGFFRVADIIFILYHGIVMALLMLSVFLIQIYIFESSLEKARTMAFAMLVMVQLIQSFNSKSTGNTLFRKDLFANKSLVAAILFSFGLLLIGIYFPFLRGIFEQTKLSLQDWMGLFIGVGIFIVLAEAFKYIRRKTSE
jgi:Ca2+-transporting ATPase